MSRNSQRLVSARNEGYQWAKCSLEKSGYFPAYENPYIKKRAPGLYSAFKKGYQDFFMEKLKNDNLFRLTIHQGYELYMEDRELSHEGTAAFRKDLGFSFRQTVEIGRMLSDMLKANKLKLRPLGGKSVSSPN